MAKSREKIQQIGFWDPEVPTPEHDAVCMWAYDNADEIFRAVCPEEFGRPWGDADICWHYEANDRVAQQTHDLARAFTSANQRPNPKIQKKTLEYVLKSYTGYQDKTERLVGYADLVIHSGLPCVAPKYKQVSKLQVFDGFELTWTPQNAPVILVEAKSVMPTLGELMRQIQLYRTAFQGKFVVVSPDDRYEKILAEQNVSFIKCTP